MPDSGGPISIVKLFDVVDPTSESSVDLNNLIGQFNRRRSIDWTIPEAFVCLLLSAAMSDGNVSIEESAEIAALTRRSRALKHLNGLQLHAINVVVKERLEKRPEGLLEACEILPPDMRLPLFAHCIDIVLADGRLLPPELHFLDTIMGFLRIDPADGKRMMEALLVKNRF